MGRAGRGITLRSLNPKLRFFPRRRGYSYMHMLMHLRGGAMGDLRRWSVVGALLAVVLSPAWAATPKASVAVSVTSADCEHLLTQFDVAWNAHSASKRAESARRTRDLGEAACHDGRYSDGVHQLKRALHDLGLKPVRRAVGPVSR
jgi:hypothetical protein